MPLILFTILFVIIYEHLTMAGPIYYVVIKKDLRGRILDTTSDSPADITPFGQQLFSLEDGLDSLFFEFDDKGRVLSYDPGSAKFLGIAPGLRKHFRLVYNPNFGPQTSVNNIADFMRNEIANSITEIGIKTPEDEIKTYAHDDYTSPRAIVHKRYENKFLNAAKIAGLTPVRIPFRYNE